MHVSTRGAARRDAHENSMQRARTIPALQWNKGLTSFELVRLGPALRSRLPGVAKRGQDGGIDGVGSFGFHGDPSSFEIVIRGFPCLIR